ncbi:hypothetical protein BPNPMPFG_002223 [Mesorhizobium sp. AR07]|nr:hypothetical protein [Mesorhizobium sp. AR07]UVK46557.1 hypothetical protein BPNPMPFG_002223 [Mesorhizobium sp. AR07]
MPIIFRFDGPRVVILYHQPVQRLNCANPAAMLDTAAISFHIGQDEGRDT